MQINNPRTVADVADELGVSARTVRQWCLDHEIGFQVYEGGPRLLSAGDVRTLKAIQKKPKQRHFEDKDAARKAQQKAVQSRKANEK